MRDKWISFGGKNPTEYVAACLPGAKLRVQWIHPELRRPLCARRLHKMFHGRPKGERGPVFSETRNKIRTGTGRILSGAIKRQVSIRFCYCSGVSRDARQMGELRESRRSWCFGKMRKNGEDIASVKMIFTVTSSL